ncbi:MAG: PilZ domain-containing protein [Deltaproteobacteria bacterium]|nr:PilZ domain-containing protein [Deltaproteobacteria bacterium]
MSEERRRFTRIPFNVTAEITINENSYIVDKINNLSVGGCFLPLVLDCEPKTACHVKISLTGSNNELSVNLDGTVVRSDLEGIAVKFTLIDPDSLIHLQHIILYNSHDTDKVEQELKDHPGLL